MELLKTKAGYIQNKMTDTACQISVISDLYKTLSDCVEYQTCGDEKFLHIMPIVGIIKEKIAELEESFEDFYENWDETTIL
jgi:NH3-dependent NAD+ synthetase